jgi:hypothetical protein
MTIRTQTIGVLRCYRILSHQKYPSKDRYSSLKSRSTSILQDTARDVSTNTSTLVYTTSLTFMIRVHTTHKWLEFHALHLYTVRIAPSRIESREFERYKIGQCISIHCAFALIETGTSRRGGNIPNPALLSRCPGWLVSLSSKSNNVSSIAMQILISFRAKCLPGHLHMQNRKTTNKVDISTCIAIFCCPRTELRVSMTHIEIPDPNGMNAFAIFSPLTSVTVPLSTGLSRNLFRSNLSGCGKMLGSW